MNMLRCVSKGSEIRETKNPDVVYRRFKGSDDILDKKTLNLTDVSSCLPSVINLLLAIADSGSTLRNKCWLCCSFVKLTTCHTKSVHVSRQVEGFFIY